MIYYVTMGKMSRNKGASGERELADKLKSLLGISARRGRQYSGSPDSPDVDSDLNLQIECKRVERLQLYQSIEQAARDSQGKKPPIVFHRKNRKPWVVIMYLDDLPEIARIVNDTKK